MVSLPESVLLVWMSDIEFICGVDEAGRGPWAGPVTAGAVILDPDKPIEGLTDSKKLSEKKRLLLEPQIKAHAIAWAVVHVSAEEIDRINIREATFAAMCQAVQTLSVRPHQILIDGNALPQNLPVPAQAIIKGDLTEPAISAASILAKTARDRLMIDLDTQFPGYGFAGHKGYGTAAHAQALSQLGPCAQHRQSFAPVRKVMRLRA
ncbi:ribonuclease HII [Hyphomonas sp. FCG-A18]|uniref:ribonuclease HII n=1 Tax=Hyphomonas sp. FCG-A18 TaxID=3080019 RepID=UPI002B2FD6D0|nr:ribonuclease HII [Hyphomonas sp. FCG-A18]